MAIGWSGRLSHGFAAADGRWMGFCNRERSAKALQARIGVMGGVLRRLSQSFASSRQVQCAGLMPEILLGATKYSYLFLAQPPLEGGRYSVARLQHPDIQDQPRGAWGSALGSSLRGSVTTSPTTDRGACIMRWWPVPGRRCRCGAGDTGLTGVGLSIGRGVDSSTLRASEVQVQILQKAK